MWVWFNRVLRGFGHQVCREFLEPVEEFSTSAAIPTDLQVWSMKNWETIPVADPRRRLGHLRATLKGTEGGQACRARG
jgi:hypothetical protein